MGSRLLEAYRTVGLVCDDVPFALHRMGKDRFVTTSVGRSFLVFDLDKLVVRMTSPPLLDRAGAEQLAALAATGERTFGAFGRDVLEWRRGKLSRELLRGEDRGFGQVVGLLVFGKTLLASALPAAGKDRGALLAIDIESGELVQSMLLGPASGEFSPTCVMHPDTYLNKVVVGSAEGQLELVNVRTGKLVYRFKCLETRGAGVSCVAQSPVVDVVGVGLTDGRIVLINMRLDHVLFEFHHKGGSVRTLSFRTDSGGPSCPAPFAMLVSGSASGELAVWDLDERRLASVVRGAHDGPVTRASFLPNEPLLVTTGEDNALKVYIFDQENGQPRLLKSRQGHKSPPTRIRYYGGDTLSTLSSGADAACCQILSAGRDRAFRVFHTSRDQLNRELSQGPLLKRARSLDVKVEELKLSPIVDFAATEARQRDWCNIVTAHANEGSAFTWSLENRVIGSNVLRPDGDAGNLSLRKLQTDKVSKRAGDFAAAQCVAISACGTFAVVGTADGVVFKYNMQSGLPRGSFPKPSAAALSKAERRERRAKRRKLNAASVHLLEHVEGVAFDEQNPLTGLRAHPERHEGAVHGVGVDSLNKVLFTAGYDGTVRFWDFVNHKLETVVSVGSPVAQLVANRDSGIFVVACDDMRVLAFDTSSRKIIRTFTGHTGRITDMCISSDARWLVTASADTSMRIWDLPTARCVEWVEFPVAVTGLTFSPTGEFLATTFANSVGITLWANKTFFGQVRADAVATKPIYLQAPSAEVPVEEFALLQDSAKLQEAERDEAEARPRVQEVDCAGELQLSKGGASKWYTLALLELIKERNKPQQPPEKPEKAPFFLATSKSVNPMFTKQQQGGAEAGDTDAAAEALASSLAQSGDWSDDDANDEDGSKADGAGSEAGSTDSGASGTAAAAAAGAAADGSRILREKGFDRPRSELFRLLEEAAAKHAADAAEGSEDFAGVVAHLAQLTPSAVDFELRSITLGPEDDDGGHLLRVTLDWLLVELRAKTNFELCQAVLSRLVQLHEDSISAREDLRKRLPALREAQTDAWKSLRGLIQHSLCLLQFFSHQV